ncbi:MAG TPA: tRNA (adenosine(37)-N6)-threonylcarbamoyltransferase complex ATPase subunit type 1 TsaE [Armatimonadota bacterium]
MTATLLDADQTRRFGAALARAVRPGDVLALSGDLGAGKTTLTQGLAAGLGISGDVLSPTFALMSEYRGGRVPLLHVDAYRLNGASDAEQLGLDEYLDDGWALVLEWPGNIAGALLENVSVRLDHDGDRRTVSITGADRWISAVEEAFARSGD